jgi:hypothetical protein
MRLVLKVGGLVVFALFTLVGLAMWKPMTASPVAWPVLEDQMLEEPFLGITADGAIEPDLFSIRATGVSTEPVVEAARAFIASLSPELRDRALFPVDDSEWRRWANVHMSIRQGVGFLDFDAAQAEAALNLLRASLSARGFENARNIMKLEGHLADLMDNYVEYGEKRYWFTLMGEPSATEPWGWQLDGHHLIINYFVLGDQVVMTPTFMGSEPPSAETGRFAGTAIMEEELELGLAMINALDDEQRSSAILSNEKLENNNRGELFQDNAVVAYEGLRLNGLSPTQAEQARALIALYIHNLREDQAEIKMAEIEQHWNDSWFAWVGETEADSVFYYRIHSPVLMIEFDHQTPIALDGPKLPTRQHVHTVVRTPNGNDYGKDLLGQHLQAHPH